MKVFRAVAGIVLFVVSACAANAALSYRLVDAELAGCRGACPKIVVASGQIGEMEGHSFIAFMEEARQSHAVSSMLVIDSPGGFNIGAETLGLVVRQVKMTVVVGRHMGGVITSNSGLTSGTCASACVLVLSGGSSRFFIPGSRVGVHRAHSGPNFRDPITREDITNQAPDPLIVKSAYSNYFRRMGIGARLADIMDETPSETMRWLTAGEMASLRLARDVTSSSGRTRR